MPSALLLILGEDIPGLVAVTPASAAAAKSAYAMTDLGNLGEVVGLGFGINASGEVVGRSYLDKVFFSTCSRHPCRFTQNNPFSWTAGTMTDLGTFSETAMGEVTPVNRGGDMVGGSSGHALLVHNGTMTDLGTGEATGINDVGQIVGNFQGAFVISGGTRTTLPDLSSYGRRLQQRNRDQQQPPDRRGVRHRQRLLARGDVEQRDDHRPGHARRYPDFY